MKKVLITIGLAALVSSASAQGLINFLNNAVAVVTLSNGTANLGPTPTGVPGTFTYELFRAPAGTLTPATFVGTGIIGTNLTTAGRLNGGNGRAVPGTLLGGTTAILVRGWSSNLGATYTEALNNWNAGVILGYLGESGIAPNFLLGGDGGQGNVPTSPAFGGASGIQNGFALVYTIPEPTSMALAGLGAASLLIFRRRK